MEFCTFTPETVTWRCPSFWLAGWTRRLRLTICATAKPELIRMWRVAYVGRSHYSKLRLLRSDKVTTDKNLNTMEQTAAITAIIATTMYAWCSSNKNNNRLAVATVAATLLVKEKQDLMNGWLNQKRWMNDRRIDGRTGGGGATSVKKQTAMCCCCCYYCIVSTLFHNNQWQK